MRQEGPFQTDFGQLYKRWHEMLAQNKFGAILRATEAYFNSESHEATGSSPRIQVGLHHFRGVAHLRLGNFSAAEFHFRRALELMQTTELRKGEEETRGELEDLLFQAQDWKQWEEKITEYDRSGKHDTATTEIRGRISQLSRRPHNLGIAARLFQHLGNVLRTKHTQDVQGEAIAAFTQAIDYSRAVGNEVLTIFSLIGRATSHDWTDEHRIMQDLREAQEQAASLTDPDTKADAYISIGTLVARSHPDRAEEILVQALYLKQQGGDHKDIGSFYENLAAVQRLLKKFTAARENMEKAYRSYRDNENKYRKTLAAAQLAAICLEMNHEQAAKEYALEALHDLYQVTEVSGGHLAAIQKFVGPVVNILRRKGIIKDQELPF